MAALKGEDVAVIAEVKRASPSKGAMAAIADPAALAIDYEAGGASVISVLTESRQFARAASTTSPRSGPRSACPCYAKTSSSLLPVVGGPGPRRRPGATHRGRARPSAVVSLVERACSLGLIPLVEVHAETEVDRAVDAGTPVIGVNARNLSTLDVTAPLRPAGSADTSWHREDRRVGASVFGRPVRRTASAGADAVLVGGKGPGD